MFLLNVVKFVLVPFDLAVSVCYNFVDERVTTLNVNWNLKMVSLS